MTQAETSFYSRQTYFPYGAQRTTEGSALPTDYTFTGQKNDDSTGLMFYGARYYDAALGRFTQPDTIVPSPLNPQSLNRFSYVLNNPVKYSDPTGHMACGTECDPGGGGGDPTGDPCYPNGCVIEPLPGGGLGEKNNNDGSIIILPAEPQNLPDAQCPKEQTCIGTYTPQPTPPSGWPSWLPSGYDISGSFLAGFGGGVALHSSVVSLPIVE